PANNNRQLIKGLILLSGILLVAACAEPPPPYAVVYEEDTAPEEVTVQAQIPEEPEPAETIVYEPEHPQTYIVQEGDTLWDISTVFLRDPWFWPEIWFKNPQVENPHLIYPGDTLAIVYVGGERMVQILSRGADASILAETAEGLSVVKVNPRIRSQAIESTIPTIPIDSLRQLLERPVVIDEDTLNNSAYILSSVDNHLINSINDKLYVTCVNSTRLPATAVTRSIAPTARCLIRTRVNCSATRRFTSANRSCCCAAIRPRCGSPTRNARFYVTIA
ncbi:MAG: LysM peptidoglycan-binding domain-containing protein, partial [Gammaproteobacteria bacterium]